MIPMGNDVMGLAEDSENHLQIFWHQVDQEKYIYKCNLSGH